MSSPRVLIVGAGAVGQVFGHHLARAGCAVSFFVKPKYLDEVKRGFTMYRLQRRRVQPERFEGFGVATTAAQVAADTWDVVLLAISSTALRAGTWLPELALATGQATIVFLQPNIDDRAYLASIVDQARIVDGMIGFIAYQAPLPGESRFPAPGMAFYFPPRMKCPFSGLDLRVKPLLDALRRGGLPAARKRDLRAISALPNAIFNIYLLALESAGWSFARLRERATIKRAGTAASQALAVAARHIGRRPPLALRLASRPLAIRAALRLAPRVIPIPLEIYLETHFTKVGDQTRLGVRSLIELGKRGGLEVAGIEDVLRSVDP